MHPAVPIALVFVGCCSNVVFLEYLIRAEPGSGNLITFSQFLFIALEGFLFTTKCGKIKPVIPLSTYAVMVSIFFVVQVVNNYALYFDIPMPLHMIFRAGSLMANLILGVIILKKSYKPSKYLSVLMISIGITVCTIVSAQNIESKEEGASTFGYSKYFDWVIGISMLLFALFMTARMGIYQETVYKQWGKHPSEALFYNHVLPLPGFLLLSKDILHYVDVFNNSEPVSVLGMQVPILWVYLIGNVITQYICIRSVFVLTTECTSLTVSLVVTLRKFVSLLFSIMYFKNHFTMYHWFGTVLVFGGTLIFTEAFPNMYAAYKAKTKKD